MTINDFLDMLDENGWRLDPDGHLMDENDHCPLWHVFYSRYGGSELEWEVEDYVEAGRQCGLSTIDAVAIAEAADNRGHPRLRRRLLSRLGISVQVPGAKQ